MKACPSLALLLLSASSLLLATQALPTGSIHARRYLLRCKITNEAQQSFLNDQVINHDLDLWSERLPTAPSEATILATSEQVERLRANLECSQGVDIKVIEKGLDRHRTWPI